LPCITHTRLTTRTQVEYELLFGTYYSLWREEGSVYGHLYVSAKHGTVKAHLHLGPGEESEFDLDFEDWHDELRRRDLLITPMIWRLGACVEVPHSSGERAVGCIVPKPDSDESPVPMFCPHDDCSYYVLSREGVPAKKTHFHKALRRLIPVGTEVYVRLKAPAVAAMGLQTLRTERSREFLSGRLNVPTVVAPEQGKVYVTCMQRPILARSDASDMACVTLVLDPWDIALELAEGEPAASYLVAAA